MIHKIKKYIKEDWKFFVVTIIFMLLTVMVVTVNCSPGSHVVKINAPFENIYVTLSYLLIFVLGGLIAFFIRNADKENIKLEKLYLWIAIPIGIVMCICTPLGRIPDEDDHAQKAMAIAQGNLFSTVDENGNATDMINAKVHEVVSRATTTYEDAWRRLNLSETENKIEMQYNTMALYAPICHAPQAIGILITRLFGAGISVQCYAGRIANFAFAIFLIYNAIKLMPYKKHLMMYIALLPVAFNILPTMSSDALTLSMILFYIAYIFHLKYDDVIINTKQKVLLIVSTIVIALCKIVYVPLCLLLFILPKEKFKNLKSKNIFVITVIIAAVVINLIWLVYCTRFLIEFNSGVDAKEQILYILTNPIQYCVVLFRTINFHFNTYYAALSGDALGTYNVKASEIFIYAAIVISSMLFLTNEEKKEEKKIKFDWITKAICALVFVAIVVLIYTSIYVQWTPLKSDFIMGVQSRYFLPILILTAIILDNDKIIIKEKINRFLLTFLLFFNINVATATIYTYYFGILIDGYIK